MSNLVIATPSKPMDGSQWNFTQWKIIICRCAWRKGIVVEKGTAELWPLDLDFSCIFNVKLCHCNSSQTKWWISMKLYTSILFGIVTLTLNDVLIWENINVINWMSGHKIWSAQKKYAAGGIIRPFRTVFIYFIQHFYMLSPTTCMLKTACIN